MPVKSNIYRQCSVFQSLSHVIFMTEGWIPTSKLGGNAPILPNLLHNYLIGKNLFSGGIVLLNICSALGYAL